MSSELLGKIRTLNKALQRTGFQPVIFSDICKQLGELLNSGVVVSSKKGKILGIFSDENYGSISQIDELNMGDYLNETINNRFTNHLAMKENTNLENLGFEYLDTNNDFKVVVAPINAGGEKLGTLFLYRNIMDFTIEDIIMVEYAATVVSLEIIRSLNEENAEELRKSTIVKSAIGTLSYSELEAVLHIFDELEGSEGLLVASKIADRVGITRSVIVNALRKFESAGVIESRSLGMKGTYIKVLNNILIDELDKLRK